MKTVVGGLSFGVGVPLFLVGCVTLQPEIAVGGAFLVMTGLDLLKK